MDAVYALHRQRYPLMEPQDVVKLYFQARMGCGHLLGDEEHVVNRIEQEESCLSPSVEEPLFEPLGKTYGRLNLRRAMAEGIMPRWIARMMQMSSSEQTGSRFDTVRELEALHDPAVTKAAQALLAKSASLPRHSEAYHRAYAPAYRVISCQCVPLFPMLKALSPLMNRPRLLVCIDGPCGSGKTTLAKHLQQATDAALIPMDDFFLPHAKKTDQRLSQPGGNADWERVVSQVIEPWQRDERITYRPYDCHADAFGQPIQVPKKQITILEGSYSLLPALGRFADLRVFLTISPALQQERIIARNGTNAWDVFRQRWIPLEQAYFTACQLPDDGCVVVRQDVNPDVFC